MDIDKHQKYPFMSFNDDALPANLMQEWQKVVDLLAQLVNVRAALIMRINDDEIEVFVSSQTKANPYKVGDKEKLSNSGLYCEAVTRSQQPLMVADAMASPQWDRNPDLKHGFVSYLGFPIKLPDGRPFGTICVLDDHPNEYSPALFSLLEKMRDLIESNLSFKKVEEDLKLARDAAEAASRAKTDFLGRVSHDLRSPLTAIMGYSQLIIRIGGQEASKAKIIHRSAKHMLGLINDLIEYARGSFDENLNEQPLYILGLLDEIAEQAKMLAQRQNNRLSFSVDDALTPVLIIDAHRLRRILLNLLDNAAKFTRNGSISVSVNSRSDAEDAARAWLDIVIADTGCGIPEAELETIFEPFVRVRNSGVSDGSGLGLAIVHMLVQHMGGSVQLSSRPGEGLIVNLALPVYIGAEADMQVHQLLDVPDALPQIDGQGRCIWLVEDNDEIRRLLQTALEGVGFVVQAYADGREVIARMRHADTKSPALVLTDYLMPGANGVDVLNECGRRWPSLRVILLSATQQWKEAMAQTPDHRFAATLLKPINLGELLLAIAGLLRIDIPAPARMPDSLAFAALSEQALPVDVGETIRQLTELGAVSDLFDYADELSARYPEFDKLAARLRALAQSGDLDGLLALAADL